MPGTTPVLDHCQSAHVVQPRAIDGQATSQWAVQSGTSPKSTLPTIRAQVPGEV